MTKNLSTLLVGLLLWTTATVTQAQPLRPVPRATIVETDEKDDTLLDEDGAVDEGIETDGEGVSSSKKERRVGGIHVIIDDTIAGIGTQAVIRNNGGNSTLVVEPPYGEAYIYEIAAEDKTVHFPGNDLEVAGVYTVTLQRGGAVANTTTAFTVLPDSIDPDNSTIQVDRTTVTPNGMDEVTVTVILRDRFGNVLPERPVRVISSRNSDYIDEMTSETDMSGQQVFTLAAVEAGEIDLRAMDLISGKVLDSQLTVSAGGAVGGVVPGQQQQYIPAVQPQYVPTPTVQYVAAPPAQYVQPVQYVPAGYVPASPYAANAIAPSPYAAQAGSFDVIDHFLIEVPRSTTVDTFENMTITAVDRNGNVVQNYVGTVAISTSPQNDENDLPGFGVVEFKPSDLGRKSLALGLRFADDGEQLLIVEDQDDPTVNSQVAINVINTRLAAAEDAIAILSPQEGEAVRTPQVNIEGTGPILANLKIVGGTRDVISETNDVGDFSAVVSLDPLESVHTITVINQGNDDNRAEITVLLELLGPEIQSLTFSPAQPSAGQEFTVTTQIDAAPEQIEAVKLTINELSYALTPSPDDATIYEGTLVLDEVGEYTTTLSATDINNQEDTFSQDLIVVELPLPKVQNLVASPLSRGMSLSWDAVADDRVNAYHISTFEDENTFENFTTKDRVTSATITDLIPGQTYLFAVAAVEVETNVINGVEVQNEKSIGEFSEIAEATVLGLDLNITPGNGVLGLEWTGFFGDASVSGYELEFFSLTPEELSQIQADPAALQGFSGEQRSIEDAELTTYLLDDLINGLLYIVRLTPVGTDGTLLTDLAAIAQGTPNGTGFNFGPVDEVPSDVHGSAPPFPPVPGVRPGNPFVPSGPPQTIPPPSPQPPRLSEEGLPFSPWWIIAVLAVCGGVYLRQRRQSIRLSQQFMQHMQRQYNQPTEPSQPNRTHQL